MGGMVKRNAKRLTQLTYLAEQQALSCPRKVRHKTLDDALVALEHSTPGLQVYLCQCCWHYHLGHE